MEYIDYPRLDCPHLDDQSLSATSDPIVLPASFSWHLIYFSDYDIRDILFRWLY